MNLLSRKLAVTQGLGLAAAAALIAGTLATAPAFAQEREWYGGGYHLGYTDHNWGYNGYYDGYVGSYGAYNDTPVWQRSYYPANYPDYYSGYYPDYDGYYGDGYNGYAPAPGIGVRVGPVGIGVFP
jgi:hypothetical protein